MTPRILVAGIGNIFFGDDAFGVEVAQRLLRRSWPHGVRVEDFGIRGLDLAWALADRCDVAILIDAVPRGEAPGTLYVIEPRIDSSEGPQTAALDAHSMDPVKVLRAAAAFGPGPPRVLLVGCEPAPSGGGQDSDMNMQMSHAVRSRLDEAADLVESLVHDVLHHQGIEQIHPACRPNVPAAGHQEIHA